MLEDSSVRDINGEIVMACLQAHSSRSFSGDLTFSHVGEMIIWKRVEFHVPSEHPERLDWLKAIGDHWPDFLVFIGRPAAIIEISFRNGRVTRTLVRSV